MEYPEIDLREALNAISDVIQNRPRPLRGVDQIYMKAADMVLQSEIVARWADGKRLAFVGDGDAISVCVAYLRKRQILSYGPTKIVVHDFDERICGAVTRFADKERLDSLEAMLYNVIEPVKAERSFDCFYTNPPWGASNEGLSVKLFTRRGIELCGYQGEGMVVIADDHELSWPQHVLANTQLFALQNGYYVQRLMSRMHNYHLDDAPNLKSCNLMLKALPDNRVRAESTAVTEQADLANFYGRENALRIRYIREKTRVDYGKAHDDEYKLDVLEENPR